MAESRVVVITGASGLLGRAVYRVFREDTTWQTHGLAWTRAHGELIKVDITQEEDVQNLFQKLKPSYIIHAAAERRPDVVDKSVDATRQLNVDATRTVCQQAALHKAVVVYISSDYVFDGTSPPYHVTDTPNPLNAYGRSKLDGETVVQSFTGNIILRVPILYGEVESLDESAVTTLFNSVCKTSSPCVMSHYERRYPTHVNDIATVIRALIRKQIQDATLTGVFHCSGSECLTKYDMAITMAQVFGLPTTHIQPDSRPSTGAPRPFDAHLDSSRLEQLGIVCRTPFSEGIKTCLTPWTLTP